MLDLLALVEGAPGSLQLGRWLSSGELTVALEFQLDGQALLFATLIAFISLLVQRFSVNYLHREAGFQRFFMVMSLFTAAMLLLATAGNLVLLFIGWELAGVSSYLLIAWAFERPVAAANATRAFVTNRIGDAGFVLGIFLAYRWLGGAEIGLLEERVVSLDAFQADLLSGVLLLAALAKSGQVPFAPWIARALEGPTPSSAIFYGSLMVHAGAWLVIRLAPLYDTAPEISGLLVLLGLLSAFYGWLAGLVQTDVKSAFMFATTTQVGLIFVWCGFGWFDLALAHLVTHALWRAWQFLHAPAFMHLVNRPPRPVPAWLRRSRTLHTAALQRLWLDSLADWLFTKPTRALARDIDRFDEQVVNRFVGLPPETAGASSLVALEQGRVHTSGALGSFMAWLADRLHWFEEHLVLHGGGEAMLQLMRRFSTLLEEVESLLSRPRYLILMVMLTLVVIL
ncbi:MAG TPA: hypothetical protein EYP90_00805 [Chromatiaceae bacterium]|nr:hypothetical protein [Chromatiaceae bacterium]